MRNVDPVMGLAAVEPDLVSDSDSYFKPVDDRFAFYRLLKRAQRGPTTGV